MRRPRFTSGTLMIGVAITGITIGIYGAVREDGVYAKRCLVYINYRTALTSVNMALLCTLVLLVISGRYIFGRACRILIVP
jgi:hypothetical protein